MRYFVDVGGKEREVHVETRPDGSTRVLVDGKSVDVDSVSFTPRTMLVRVGGAVLDLTVEGSPPALGIIAAGRRTYVRAESDRMRAALRIEGPGAGAKDREIRAPMPGRIVRVMVREGDEVAAGQAVVVVEAMKMENEIRARKGGTVAKVNCATGDTVAANGVLLKFA